MSYEVFTTNAAARPCSDGDLSRGNDIYHNPNPDMAEVTYKHAEMGEISLSLSLHFSKVLILNLPIGITLYKCKLSKLQLHRYGFLGFLKFFFHFKTIAKLEISLC